MNLFRAMAKYWMSKKNHWNTAIVSQILHDKDFCSSGWKNFTKFDMANKNPDKMYVILLYLFNWKRRHNKMTNENFIQFDLLDLVFFFVRDDIDSSGRKQNIGLSIYFNLNYINRTKIYQNEWLKKTGYIQIRRRKKIRR